MEPETASGEGSEGQTERVTDAKGDLQVEAVQRCSLLRSLRIRAYEGLELGEKAMWEDR